jgi:hypothetical protein
VTRPRSGAWAILTHERGRGLVSDMSWSPDSSVVYFDRLLDVPQGIFSVPVIGGDGTERLVLENAMSPNSVGDGTLVVAGSIARAGRSSIGCGGRPAKKYGGDRSGDGNQPPIARRASTIRSRSMSPFFE